MRQTVPGALFAAVLAAVTALASGTPARAVAPAPGRVWTGSWTATATAGTGDGFTDTTLREIVHPTLGGDRLRIRLTNLFGTAPVTFDDVTVGVRDTGARLVPGTLRRVAFGGARSVTVRPGEETRSDPVALPVRAGRDLAVSVHVPDSGPAPTRHPIASTTSYLSTGSGDRAADAGDSAFTATTTSWYLLDGVDVRATRPAGAVVAFGDSITDGTKSTVDADADYPDVLARRLAAGPHGRRMAVLNEGASGNRILTDAGGSGVSALHRFRRDALGQTGVRDVIFLEGINDIGHNLGPDGSEPVTAGDLIAAMKKLIRAAHAAHVRIIGGTLTPIGGSKYDTPEAEAKRRAVNDWIRHGGAFDAVVDFDAVTRDPQDPSRFAPAFNSGDSLHPNDAGYRAMANAIDLRLPR